MGLHPACALTVQHNGNASLNCPDHTKRGQERTSPLNGNEAIHSKPALPQLFHKQMPSHPEKVPYYEASSTIQVYLCIYRTHNAQLMHRYSLQQRLCHENQFYKAPTTAFGIYIERMLERQQKNGCCDFTFSSYSRWTYFSLKTFDPLLVFLNFFQKCLHV